MVRIGLFFVWGAVNALFIMPSVLMKTNRNHLEIVAQGENLPTVKEFFQMAVTFFMAVFAWIFFRAENLDHAIQYLNGVFSRSLFTTPSIRPYYLIVLITLFMIVEWIGREQQYAISNVGLKWKKPIRYAMYYAILVTIFWFAGKEQQVIYFQF